MRQRVLLLLVAHQRAVCSTRGLGLVALVRHLRTYGYLRSWITRAIESMVRDRLLECLEVPTAADYTKDYELATGHSYRPSPLGLLLLEKIQFRPSYLAVVGNELPFHRKHAFDRYVQLAQVLRESLNESDEYGAVTRLLTESETGRLVARYLVESLEDERPIGRLREYVPEVGVVEDALSGHVGQLREIAGTSTAATWSPAPLGQLPLFKNLISRQDLASTGDVQQTVLAVPEGINDVKIGNSTSAPLILWALVSLALSGQTRVRGVDITKEINRCLVDDHSKKEPTNISRSLRGTTLRNQLVSVQKGRISAVAEPVQRAREPESRTLRASAGDSCHCEYWIAA